MDTKRIEQAKETLLEELAKQRLGYSFSPAVCLRSRKELGSIEFEDAAENLSPAPASSDQEDERKALSGGYCTEETAAKMLRVTVLDFRNLCVMPDCVISNPLGEEGPKPLYLRSKIEGMRKTDGFIQNPDVAVQWMGRR